MNFEGNKLKKDSEQKEHILESFCDKLFSGKGDDLTIYISLENLKEAKDSGIKLEDILNFASSKYGFLMHGSIKKVVGGELDPGHSGKVFASNNAAIAIMRSCYSNKKANLEYPLFISKEDPMNLVIHKKPMEDIIVTDRGFVYIVNKDGFENDPEGSWQFTKTKSVDFLAVVETEKEDFNYPVKIENDL